MGYEAPDIIFELICCLTTDFVERDIETDISFTIFESEAIIDNLIRESIGDKVDIISIF